jgi:hypothetical protein
MHPIAETFWHDGSTTGAFLRGSTGVHSDRPFASFFRFANENRQELSPTSVQDVLRQTQFDQAGDVQFFVTDHVILPQQVHDDMVMKVLPRVLNPLVRSHNGSLRLSARAAAFGLTREHLLCLSETRLGALEEAWVVDGRPICKRGKVREANVDACWVALDNVTDVHGVNQRQFTDMTADEVRSMMALLSVAQKALAEARDVARRAATRASLGKVKS